MQTLLVIRDGTITIQNAEKTYTDTLDNFVMDGGILPVTFQTVDYCRDTRSCLIDGETKDFPDGVPPYVENVIQNIDRLLAEKAIRDKAIEDVKTAEDMRRMDEESQQAERERIAAMTPEEKAAYDLEQAKAARSAAVDEIKVTVDEMVFDGNEESQDRMSRAVIMAKTQADAANQEIDAQIQAVREAMEEGGVEPETAETQVKALQAQYQDYLAYETFWVLADNTIASVTIRQLAQAAFMAGQMQTSLWLVPYQDN